MNAPLREILVRARDAGGILLNGSVFTWTEDGADRGRIDPSDGHTTLRPRDQNSIIEITVDYNGQQQHRKLAVGQTLCEFTFTVAPAPSTSEKDGIWRNPVFLGTVVTALAGLLVAYWQFVRKPESEPSSGKVTVIVYVKDRETRNPVPLATVRLEGAGLQTPSLADSQGAAVFPLVNGRGQTMTVIATAPGYVDGSQTITASDQPIQLLLDKKVGVTQRPTKPAPGSLPVNLNGTWEVRLQGDIALSRVRSGTVAFAGLPDGRFTIVASLEMDGSAMNASGMASRQGDRLFFELDVMRAGETWKATGQFEIAGGQLRGFVTDSGSKPVPLTLHKH